MMLFLDRANHCLVCKALVDIYSRHKNLNDVVEVAGGRTVRSCLEQVLDVSLADSATIWLCSKCYADLEQIQLYYNLVKHYRERFHNTVQLVAPPGVINGNSSGYGPHLQQYDGRTLQAQTHYTGSNLLPHSSQENADMLLSLENACPQNYGTTGRTGRQMYPKYDHPQQQPPQYQPEQPQHHPRNLTQQTEHQEESLPLQQHTQQPQDQPHPPQQQKQTPQHQHQQPPQGDEQTERHHHSQHHVHDQPQKQQKQQQHQGQQEQETRQHPVKKALVDGDFFDEMLDLQAIPEVQIKKEVERVITNAGSDNGINEDDDTLGGIVTSVADVTETMGIEGFVKSTAVTPTKVNGSVMFHTTLTTTINVTEGGITEEASIKCSICDQIFKTDMRLKRHMLTHSRGGPFKCSICNKGFVNKKQLRLHTLCHVIGSDSVDETTCSGSHLENMTDESKPVVLSISKEDPLEEQGKVAKPKTYTCRICLKSFTESRLLRLHRRTIHGVVKYTAGRSLQCPDCAERFDGTDQLREHLRSRMCDWPWKCHLCEAGFVAEIPLKRHLRTHANESRLTCPVCGKRLSDAGYMKEHLRIHSGEMPHQCLYCKKRFNNPSNLKQHERIHTGEKPYKCLVCGMAFRQIGQKNVHEMTHTGKAPHVCATCGKEFFWACSYKKHLQIHSDHKPELCSTCGKSFRNIPALHAHARSHSDVRPHVCSYCAKGFKTSKHLSVHKRIHTGEKPFICELCGRGFSQTTGLKFHLKSHNVNLNIKP